MATFTVSHSAQDRQPFQVLGPDGLPVPAINTFLAYLATCGRSAYTQRAYATGLAHFFCWLRDSGTHADAVTRHVIGQYIGDFSRGAKGGACLPDPQRAGQVNLLTRKPSPAQERQPRTINHRLSVLASYFAYRIQQDTERQEGPWLHRANPVAPAVFGTSGRHGMVGRDEPPRGRMGEFRRRVPRPMPTRLDPALVERLINAAVSWRDKAILTLLYRTGQRIGDWSAVAGRHGVLGMTLADIDERRRTITVRLKGARDDHQVPVTDDFWPLLRQYLMHERVASATTGAAWLGLRKGKGEPLSYAAFESSLRYIGRKIGANVHAHMLRHTLAQGVLETTGNLKLVQDILGHAHIGTTADLYTHTDQRAMVEALSAVKTSFDAARQGARPPATPQSAAGVPTSATVSSLPAGRYVFAYDQATIDELERAATQQPGSAEGGTPRWTQR